MSPPAEASGRGRLLQTTQIRPWVGERRVETHPVRRHVAPQPLEVLLEQIGPNRPQVATHQVRQPVLLRIGEMLRTLEQEPAAVLEHRRLARGGELPDLGRADFVDRLGRSGS